MELEFRKRRCGSIKKDLRKLTKKTSLQSFKMIIDSKDNLTRLIWVVFLIIFSIILIQNVLNSIRIYLNYEVVTNMKLKKLNLTENFYPLITIKIINWLSFKNYLQTFLRIEELSDLVRSGSNNNDTNEDFIISRNEFIASYEQLKSSLMDMNQKNELMESKRSSNESDIEI